ncbi:MAG: hypothetical protein HZB26_22550 [Candidatus Hydrogenedentes bacterium]|nr:hypothetical protein [Candidatus Hydrogenedentota bacterium]
MDQQPANESHRRRVSTREFVVIIGLLGLLFLLVLLAPRIYNADIFHPKAACQMRLKQFSVACRLYADENNGYYPPIQDHIGPGCSNVNTSVFMVNGSSLYPTYLTDPSILVCPTNAKRVSARDWVGADGVSDPCRFDDSSYIYLGLMIREAWFTDPKYYSADKTVAGILDALHSGKLREVKLEGGHNGIGRFVLVGGPKSYTKPETVLRLRNGLERFMLTDINGPDPPGGWDAWARVRTVVAFDTFESSSTEISFNHTPDGGNVLYMDGHVEFHRSGAYPYIPAWAEILRQRKSQGASPIQN